MYPGMGIHGLVVSGRGKERNGEWQNGCLDVVVGKSS